MARAPSQRAHSSSPAQHPRFVTPSETAIPNKKGKASEVAVSSAADGGT
jgi:hypothetical protein